MQSIPETLSQYQFQHHLTQQQMAHSLGISQATYNNWVNNKAFINPKYYPSIAEICKVSLSSLIPPDSKIGVYSKSFDIETNVLPLYQKMNQSLEEQVMMLKREILRLESVADKKIGLY